MKIFMNEDIETHIIKSSNNFEKCEVAFLAVGRFNNEKNIIIEYIFKEFVDNNSKSNVDIDKLSQLSLIKYCIINNLIPVVIHTHVNSEYNLGFSHGDNTFEQAFAKASNFLGYRGFFISILYGKDVYIARKFNRYYFKYVNIYNQKYFQSIRTTKVLGFYRFIDYICKVYLIEKV